MIRNHFQSFAKPSFFCFFFQQWKKEKELGCPSEEVGKEYRMKMVTSDDAVDVFAAFDEVEEKFAGYEFSV